MNASLLRSTCAFALISVAGYAQTSAPTSSQSTGIYEKRDESGRLLTRITFNADGTLTHRAISYGLESESLTVEDHLDGKRESIRSSREQIDRRGRPVERVETTHSEGRTVTKKTTFKYDAKGRQTAETRITE